MAPRFNSGGSRSTRRERPILGKQLVNSNTCGCESNAPLFVICKAGREPTPYWWKACMSCWIKRPNSLSHPGPWIIIKHVEEWIKSSHCQSSTYTQIFYQLNVFGLQSISYKNIPYPESIRINKWGKKQKNRQNWHPSTHTWLLSRCTLWVREIPYVYWKIL